MTPTDFLHSVVAPNVEALESSVGDLRLAVNAFLTLDALAGVVHADRRGRGLEQGDDHAFRNRLAAQHLEYRILRDAAFALKHGQLNASTRLVQRAQQVVAYSSAWDEAVWDRSHWDKPALVWVEANDPAHSRLAYELARAVLNILQNIV
ncbi:hypothetical protein [Bradyrhizobium sp. SZCCHNRI20481]|uniref:hypothetical protein n=1 Tax=Bradyrhizobium sp. SZCCHNRI20481 TaxID=3057286 RepID=UPI002915D682|nr:hypothetical protein [Bradyrhizobium sp. SZCCHNRI20481]